VSAYRDGKPNNRLLHSDPIQQLIRKTAPQTNIS